MCPRARAAPARRGGRTRRPGDTAFRGRGRGTSTPGACRSTSPPWRARRRGGAGRRGGRPGRGWRRRSRCRGRTAAARARRPPFPTPAGARRAYRSSSSCGSPRRACVETKLSRRVHPTHRLMSTQVRASSRCARADVFRAQEAEIKRQNQLEYMAYDVANRLLDAQLEVVAAARRARRKRFRRYDVA